MALCALPVRSATITTNVTLRVMAANLSSGGNQRYETAGLNIFKGLAPDIVAMQEFNVSNSLGINTTAAISNMVATTFGPEFSYFREAGSYTIPNGIISRYPIITNASWVDSDTGVDDRGFAWALIDLPGTNKIYVVSVHLKASSGSANATRRGAEAAELKDLITTNFPAGSWIVVAGDMNLYSDTEAAITTFKTFLADTPVPVDQKTNNTTNAGRDERYDRVLTSFSMTNRLVPLVMPSRTYSNGLVFDSRVYTPIAEVAPVQTNDSGAVNMQHMAVVKAFTVSYEITNGVIVVNGDRFWTNRLGGNYQDTNNWLNQLVPQAVDGANFTNNASYQVNWLTNALASNAVFNASSGTVTQAPGTFSWTVTNTYIVGRDATATATVTHASGILYVTNSAGTAQLRIGDAGRGTFNLAGGVVVADALLATNGARSIFNLTGGTLRTRSTTGNPSGGGGGGFSVGTASSAATFELLGENHSFPAGLTIQAKGLLTGTGAISANVTVAGSISPGPGAGGIGRLNFTGSTLNFNSSSTNWFDINKATGTNDVIASTGTINLGGTLVVTNLGGVLTNGDRFRLFSGVTAGGFNQLVLPALGSGLSWTNRLSQDGSLEVFVPIPPVTSIEVSGAALLTNGAFQLSFTNVSGAAFTVLSSTNLFLAATNWTVLGSATEIAPGQFRFTDPQATNDPLRFYRVRSL